MSSSANDVNLNVDPASTIQDEATPLHRALEAENEELVMNLLQSSASAKLELSEGGSNLLFTAARSGKAALVESLLATGLDVNVHVNNDRKLTALHVAARYNHVDLARLLLDRGIQTNAQDSNGDTALHLAVDYVSTQVVELLLAYVLGLTNNHNGENPLHLALMCDRGEELIDLLLEKSLELNIVNKPSATGSFPLHYAIRNDSPARLGLVCSLLEHGADVEAEDKSGKTPLFLAIELEAHEVVQYLLTEAAANANGKRPDRIPLFAAIKLGDVDSILMLLARGARADVADEKDHRPLGQAIHKLWNNSELHQVCLALLDNGAEVNYLDSRGFSPLHLAIKLTIDERLTKILIARGANGRTALKVAVIVGNEEIVKVLVRGCNASEELLTSMLGVAIENLKHRLVRYFLESGANVNLEVDGEVPLVKALSMYQNHGTRDWKMIVYLLLKSITLLIARGVYVHQQNIQKIEERAVLSKEYKFYCLELERMKSTKVSDESTVTYFDLLTKRHNALLRCLGCRSVRNALASAGHRRRFFNYTYELEENWSEGLKRWELLDRYQRMLHEVLASVLPYDITIQISECFSCADLEAYFKQKS